MLTNKGYVGIRQINTHSKDGREEGKKERKPFILYRRASGGLDGRIYYVAFWDPAARRYTNRRSTNKTAKGAAENQACNWLAEGLPVRDAGNLRSLPGGLPGRKFAVPRRAGGAAQASVDSLRGQRALCDW